MLSILLPERCLEEPDALSPHMQLVITSLVYFLPSFAAFYYVLALSEPLYGEKMDLGEELKVISPVALAL